MTFRAKPVVKRAHRPAWEAQDRRNFYLNLGFGLIVILALVILAVAAGLSYYSDHLASVGSVNGESISKDAFKARLNVDAWRIKEEESRISTAVLAGHLTEEQGATQRQTITQQRDKLAKDSLERLIDSRLQAALAASEGVTATPEDIDARLIVEATSPELRHAWGIEVAPVTDPGAIGPTAAQKADAKTKAEAALKSLQDGKSWDEVARTVSTDASTAPQAGDLGWLQADDPRGEEALLKAVFAAPVNTPTGVVEGIDGVFRIGRATEIAASSVDAAYQAKIQNDGVDLEHYREVVAADVIHEKLQGKIVAGVTGPGPQRDISEIYIREAAAGLGADAIKVRHILYAPKGDPAGAAKVPATDPSWAAAQVQATTTYTKLKDNPNLFDATARQESNEGAAQGPTGTGGKLPYFDGTSNIDPDFKAAIVAPGLKEGDLLPPVKSSFGWHVIQVMNRPTDLDRLKAVKDLSDNKGADFAVLARDTSEAQSSGIGGDAGWVAKGQFDDQVAAAIFATPIGRTSEVVTVPGDGLYLFKVAAEEVRTPAGRQLQELTSTAFSKWYDAKKSEALITRDEAITTPVTNPTVN